MTRPWGARLLLLTIPLALVDSADLDNMKVKVLRELKKVSPSSANVRQCLWFAMQEFNRESAEKHLFQVVKVLQVHLQDRYLPGPILRPCPRAPVCDPRMEHFTCHFSGISRRREAAFGGKDSEVHLPGGRAPLAQRLHRDEERVRGRLGALGPAAAPPPRQEPGMRALSNTLSSPLPVACCFAS
ncbi:uncharacterized protein [Vicugna pacos]|uniref:Uncharacterized protein isoform X1 n=1 Tax=Vicugna pacos TaxID=30538 RepID=A0ABM5BTC2_VICPA